MEIDVDDNGKYFIINKPQTFSYPIRKEYYPIGNKLLYPKEWGRKKAASILLEHHIDNATRIVESNQERLRNLEILRDDVAGWDD
jgi:hypothetical protein